MQENFITRARPLIGSTNQCRRGQPGNVLWLAADQFVWKDANQTPAGNGDPVRGWGNLDVYGSSAFQLNSAQQPTFLTNQLNGLPVVSFTSAASQCLYVNNPVNFSIPTPTIFLVGSGSSGSFMGKGNGNASDGSHRKMQVRVNSSTQINYWSGTDAQSGNAAAATMASYNVFCIIPYLGTKVYYNVNGTETYNSFTIDIQTMNANQLMLGAGFDIPAEFGTVNIAEVLIYNRPLLKYQIDEEMARLGSKWGIGVTTTTTYTFPARSAAGSRTPVS